MVVKEVAVISAPLFGGVMAIVQLVSVTAGGTQKRHENNIKLTKTGIILYRSFSILSIGSCYMELALPVYRC